MTTNRPYLLRAFYQWIVDNHMTPQLVVNAELPGVVVPRQYVNDGKIILNVTPKAVQELELSNHGVSFYASFSGVSTFVVIPIIAVIAIYARENGRGMVFPEDSDELEPPPKQQGPAGQGRAHLKVVK